MTRKTHLLRLPDAHGSSDALQLLEWRRQRGTPPQPLAIVCARSADCARLQGELSWFDPALRIAVLPDWETLPWDPLSPHQDLVSNRLATLMALHRGELDVLLVAATTAIHRLLPAQWLAGRSFAFHKGQRINEAGLRSQLALAGYDAVSQVVRPGEFAVRGNLIDLYPTGSVLPYRLDLFDDELESIRVFDPDTQRSLHPVDNVHLLPGREFPFDDAARQQFRSRWRETFDGDPSRAGVYRDVGNGIASAGIEYYLPFFFESTATLFEYLDESAVLVLHGDLQEPLTAFHQDALERWRFLSRDPERPILPPDQLFLSPEAFFVACHDFDRLALQSRSREESQRRWADAPPTVAVNRRQTDPLQALRQVLEGPAPVAGQEERRLVLAESAGRRETLHELFREHGLNLPQCDDWAAAQQSSERILLTTGPLYRGFRAVDGRWLVITEAELFPGQVRRLDRAHRQQATQVDHLVRDLSELKPGDPVVHAQHGIGRYQGLVNLDLGDGLTEFLHLMYANEAVLYVPVAQLHVISRYAGAAPEAAPLHTLGSGQWEKARRKAAERARDTAAELLELYARRAARPGHSMAFQPAEYEAFVEGFGFEETPDQLAAIHAVIQDLVAARPMDRLVCGDVGFGKTEVALRAAFITAMSGRQVAVLTPTTLLAEQHFQTFSDRFANWPLRVAELSRFRSTREVRTTLEGLANGTVDIVIGTHKLLSKETRFDRLGLVIIDEEHRFGVRQKDALKALRAEVDVLTLTATPIPRTLAMSLEGIRDFSVIATAPQKRLSIKTFVRDERASAIREALLRELKRGGQVYFLHNEVETIENRRQMLTELVPEAQIRVAHGQMAERDLEHVMRDFHQQRFNVLLCTTIIETGIDIPSANTIVIHRADRFGLAQLHQLRGRVGRSHHQAYAYLLIPGEGAITRDAEKRLEAIQMLEDLGSGFHLAMHDLEIRGAGEVLGDHQSGDIQEVGFSLYTDMLNRAVRAMKAGRIPDVDRTGSDTVEIRLHAPALLPEDYCPDVHERLMLYKRLGNCTDADEVALLREELVDRFGKLPQPALTLVESHRLRLDAEAIGLVRIDAAPETLVLQFASPPQIEPLRILAFAQSRRDTQFAGQDRLRISHDHGDIAARTRWVRELLQQLQTPLTDRQTLALKQGFRADSMQNGAPAAAPPPSGGRSSNAPRTPPVPATLRASTAGRGASTGTRVGVAPRPDLDAARRTWSRRTVYKK